MQKQILIAQNHPVSVVTVTGLNQNKKALLTGIAIGCVVTLILVVAAT